MKTKQGVRDLNSGRSFQSARVVKRLVKTTPHAHTHDWSAWSYEGDGMEGYYSDNSGEIRTCYTCGEEQRR